MILRRSSRKKGVVAGVFSAELLAGCQKKPMKISCNSDLVVAHGGTEALERGSATQSGAAVLTRSWNDTPVQPKITDDGVIL